MTYRPGKAIIQDMLETRSVREIADCLNIDPTHIYNIKRRGVSPTLHEALIDAGWLEPPARVHTVAFRFEDEDDADAFRALIDAHPGDRTAWALEQVRQQ